MQRQPKEQILRIEQVTEMIGLSRSTIWKRRGRSQQ
ncbi:MAG: AlpA family phage regulatory protein [Colwellia sp.]|nr:AlpA family phage regulatory protein [Colwellia sp.]